jgi:hypothetical protein
MNRFIRHAGILPKAAASGKHTPFGATRGYLVFLLAEEEVKILERGGAGGLWEQKTSRQARDFFVLPLDRQDSSR